MTTIVFIYQSDVFLVKIFQYSEKITTNVMTSQIIGFSLTTPEVTSLDIIFIQSLVLLPVGGLWYFFMVGSVFVAGLAVVFFYLC
jgi:hypothetical protein